jgi:hypothetical protein
MAQIAHPRAFVRFAGALLLALAALFYLQFGLQALVNFVPQGVLALLGAFALGRGAYLRLRGERVAFVVFLGTVPLLLLHAVMTLIESGELPFLIGSAPVPVVAGVVWLKQRARP